jgi:hypothetical protein
LLVCEATTLLPLTVARKVSLQGMSPLADLRYIRDEMTPDQWREYERGFQPLLGRLIANLSAFEATLRITLYLIDTPKADWRPMNWKITDLRVGDVLPKDHLSSFDSLTDLIDAYNDRNANDSAQLIDREIVDLRNALAHGRILAPAQYAVLVLTRFGKPDRTTGEVRVIARYELTLDWLDEQVGKVSDASRSLHARMTAELKRSG